MSEMEQEKAVFSRAAGAVTARLGRLIDHTPAEIWGMLTDAGRLPLWLAAGTVEQRLGGAVRLDFADSGTVIDSQVSAFEPMRRLEYSWSSPGEPLRPVRWELEAEGQACRLTLTLTVPEAEDAGRACAGWEAHLEMLAAALEGVPIKFPFETFKAARDAYRGQLGAL